MSDTLLSVVLFVVMPLGVIAMASWLLHYFVALNLPPTQRAAWITGISYIIASALWLFGGPEGDRWEGPFAAIPGGLIVFWFWQSDFRRDWIDHTQGVPEGVELANTDWRIGLAGLVSLLVAAAIKMTLLRSAVGH